MITNNYREQFEKFAHAAHQHKIERTYNPEARLRSLYDKISNVVTSAQKPYRIETGNPCAPEYPDMLLRFTVADFPLDSGDLVVLGVEKQGWIRTHENMVFIAIEGPVDLPEGRGKKVERMFDHQFIIEKKGTYTFIYSANSISGKWERVENWKDKDPKGYVGYLEKVFAAAQKKQ